MKIKTNVKPGGKGLNHNEKLVGAGKKSKALKVKTGVRAGGTGINHNESLVRNTAGKV